MAGASVDATNYLQTIEKRSETVIKALAGACQGVRVDTVSDPEGSVGCELVSKPACFEFGVVFVPSPFSLPAG